jgi:two-component sensor histidine kinase
MAAENGEETSGSATPTWADVLTDGLLAGEAGVWRWEVGTDDLLWSDNMEAIHRLPPGSFDRTFNSFAGTIHPDDGERVLDAFRKAVSDGEHYTAQYRLAADPAAATRWIEARGRVIRDPQGRAVRVTGISQDITAHKNAEAELALRARQQEAVAQLGERALAGAAQNDIFAEAARTVAELAEAEFAEILELSQERDTLTRRAGHGWDDGAAGQPVATSDPNTQIGTTLRSQLPVLVTDFSTERRFTRPERLAAQGIESGASVAIAGSEGIAFGALAVYCRRPRCITPTDVRFLQSVANVLGSAIRATQDQERRELLISELRHRVGNLFSLVQALHRQTGQSAHDAHDLEMKFGARLAALATAHSLILDTGWQKTSLRSLLQTTLAPYIDRVEFNGTDVRMPADAAFSFSMALHELATNANKYGALSVPDGRLFIETRSAPDALGQKLVLVWKEQDGPPPPTEESEGFGSRLITQVVERQLSGQVARVLEPDGLRIVVEFPIA